MNRIKNRHSPPGMGYSLYGTKYIHLKDCPNCKYGTLDLIRPKDGKPFYRCADCQRDTQLTEVP